MNFRVGKYCVKAPLKADWRPLTLLEAVNSRDDLGACAAKQGKVRQPSRAKLTASRGQLIAQGFLIPATSPE